MYVPMLSEAKAFTYVCINKKIINLLNQKSESLAITYTVYMHSSTCNICGLISIEFRSKAIEIKANSVANYKQICPSDTDI